MGHESKTEKTTPTPSERELSAEEAREEARGQTARRETAYEQARNDDAAIQRARAKPGQPERSPEERRLDSPNPVFLQAHFTAVPPSDGLPIRFGIVTAFNPIGPPQSISADWQADIELRQELMDAGRSHFRVTGGARDGSHSEPGFGIVADSPDAVRVFSRRFHQDAFFWVEDGVIYVINTDGQTRHPVDRWEARQANLPGAPTPEDEENLEDERLGNLAFKARNEWHIAGYRIREIIEKNGRVCPMPKEWDQFWKMLPFKTQLDNGWEPPTPLILAAWDQTSDEQKRARFVIHINWARKGSPGLVEAARFLSNLSEEQWLHSSPPPARALENELLR